jgi:uncharacterized membrane protein YbaN (DUF454 family)
VRTPDVFRNKHIKNPWEEKEVKMIDKFKGLDKGTKILIILGAVIVLGVLIYIGVDPAQDFAGLND